MAIKVNHSWKIVALCSQNLIMHERRKLRLMDRNVLLA
jgi:hypothetical protein